MENVSVNINSNHGVITAEILTERIHMRLFQKEDFEDALKIYSDKKLTRLFDFGKPLSNKEIENLVEKRAYVFSKKGMPLGIFSAFYIATEEFMGHFDILPINTPGIVEVGCILKREFQNKDLGLEGTKALVYEYTKALNSNGFCVHGSPIKKVIATTHPKNFAAIAILKSIGMARGKEGVRFGAPRIWYNYDL
jgi:RimJ/RimL family protein N-acetyltransferase